MTTLHSPLRGDGTKRRCGVIAACISALLVACGPIEYVNTVTQRAAGAIAIAKREGAPDRSPYWWTRANLFFHKAKEEAAHAGFAAANRFGSIATEAAERAAEEAASGKVRAEKN